MPHIIFADTHTQTGRGRERESRHATLLLTWAVVCGLPPEAVGHWQPAVGQLELLQQMCRCVRTYSLESTEVVPLLSLIHCALEPLTWAMWCKYVDMPTTSSPPLVWLTFSGSVSSFMRCSCGRKQPYLSSYHRAERSMFVLLLQAKDSQMTWRAFLQTLSSHPSNLHFQETLSLFFFFYKSKKFQKFKQNRLHKISKMAH